MKERTLECGALPHRERTLSYKCTITLTFKHQGHMLLDEHTTDEDIEGMIVERFCDADPAVWDSESQTLSKLEMIWKD